ncbi:LPS export ABC transporter permease LptF [Geomonas sp.]|uniref:LPS export ABC transporter permease LptF n=1 Tax=Geomonas sp. TaxID=2651584 RepID=UPI002B476911|nr:LPS export ABC transporter permease LptF [Geomonas sp.]HJV36512.1 LPS export ABC transporter permease LptF [Geomonas sp.]
MKKTINAYIFKEIPPPFLVGIGTFTFVLLMGRFLKLAELVVEKGVPLGDVAWMVLYLLPSFWLFTIPMALLMAVLLAFGRLSSDSEVTAMKSCGISLYGMLPPALIFACFACAGCLAIAVYGVPWGNSSFKNLLVEIAQNSAGVMVKEKVFNDAFPGMVIYADGFDNKSRSMKGIIIHDERNPNQPATIFANSGVLLSDRRAHAIEFHLRNGSIHRPGEGSDGYRLVGFQEYDIRVAMKSEPLQIKGEGEMTLYELKHPPSYYKLLDPKLTRSLLLEYHSRLALPFACLVFTLLALPLGIQNRRSGRAAGFSLSIGVILLYYVTLSACKTLGEKQFFTPALACWTPNLLFLLLGIYLLRKAAAEEPLPLTLFIARLKTQLPAIFGGRGRG